MRNFILASCVLLAACVDVSADEELELVNTADGKADEMGTMITLQPRQRQLLRFDCNDGSACESIVRVRAEGTDHVIVSLTPGQPGRYVGDLLPPTMRTSVELVSERGRAPQRHTLAVNTTRSEATFYIEAEWGPAPFICEIDEPTGETCRPLGPSCRVGRCVDEVCRAPVLKRCPRE